jgi:sugar phosphate isomerase/epimerase
MAYHIANALRKRDIRIAVLGCYINPIHPDEDVKRKSLDRFKEHIRFARDFGCSIVGTETGSFNADLSYHPDNHTERGFNAIVESVSELVEEAEKFGVIVGIEAVTKNTIGSAKIMKRVLDTVKSNNLQVIFDPVNILDLNNHENQEEVFKEAVDLLGDRIVAMHAKDYQVVGEDLKTVPVGTGLMNYESVLKLIKPKKPFINILLEDHKEQYMDAARDYLTEIYNRV